MKVKDAMSKHVITVSPEDSIDTVIDVLTEKNISGVPVIKDKKVVGIISESDILRKIGVKSLISIKPEDVERINKMLTSLKVNNVMKGKIYYVKGSDDVEEAVRIMNEKDVNRVPVIDDKRNLIGILTRGDVIRVFAKSLGKWLLLEKKAPIILETDVDKFLKIIEEKGSVSTNQMANELNVNEEKVEEWGKLLEEHGLIRLEYPPFGKPILKAKGKV